MKKIAFIWITFLLSLAGCGDYLDMVPEDDIETIETIFEQKAQAEYWFKTCYQFLQNNVGSSASDPSFTGADEVVAGEYWRTARPAGFLIGDGLQMSQSPYGNMWLTDGYYAAIRYCNIFLDNIFKVYNMPDTEKRLWAAEIKGLKAFIYYQLVLRYGPIILVPENIDVTESVKVMQQPRSHVDTCINAIVALCDEAIVDLPLLETKDLSRVTYFSKEGAAALKAKALLLAASPLYNGNPAFVNFKNKNGEPLVSTTPDREKWKRAALAADTAILICEQGGRSLVSGSQLKQTPLLNVMNDIEYSILADGYENSEALFMIRSNGLLYDKWTYVAVPNIPREVDYDQYNSYFNGCVAPSMKMVEMYYTDRGLPMDEDGEWNVNARYTLGREYNVAYRDVVPVGAMDVLRLHLRREPRFYACIAADRCYWQRGEDINYNLLVESRQGEKFGTSATTINSSVGQGLTGYWLKKGTYSNTRGANYGTKEEGLVLIRMAELYLIKAEAWNEYLNTPNYEQVYAPLNVVRNRAGIPDVEVSWSYAKNPGKVKTQAGMREIIHREWNIEFAFEGHRFWNLRRWLMAHTELNEPLYGWNILGDNANSFYNDFKKPIVVWSKRKFVAPRDYLFPLSAEEVLKAGCVQNPGW